MNLIVDNFAGGGGASLGIRMALGRDVDIAVNHDENAIVMHAANHPHTEHLCESVWTVDPIQVCRGRPVELAWFSPDCKHFSRAKGGKPVEKRVRGLAWVAVKWAKLVRPRVICLENVREFIEWGPLGMDNLPRLDAKGKTFNRFVAMLRNLGYAVEWRNLNAADYGAPTCRKRLFLIARCDGERICWPFPTHSQGDRLFGSSPWRTAAECIDFSLPCPSIFDRKRPLADKTLRRIAAGLRRFVIDSPDPFIVTCNHSGDEFRGQSIKQPFATITGSRDAHGVVMPHVQKFFGGVVGHSVNRPIGTITAVDHHAVASAYLTKYHGQKADESRCPTPDDPISTLDTQNRFGLCAAYLEKFYGTARGSSLDAPAPTITGQAGGGHLAEVRAFLVKYYGCGTGQRISEPAATITSRDRLGLVTVHGVPHQIVDIGLRMLTPRELARCQGFPDDYVLTGTKANQVARIGNSVCPQAAAAIVRANVSISREEKEIA